MSISDLRKALGEHVEKARESPIGIVKHGETIAYIVSPELYKMLEIGKKLNAILKHLGIDHVYQS